MEMQETQNLITDLDILDRNQPTEEVKTTRDHSSGNQRKLYIESYGCQMNYSDSEIVASILTKEGFDTTSKLAEPDLIFLNPCSIGEKAEHTVRNRLNHINGLKKKKPQTMSGVPG